MLSDRGPEFLGEMAKELYEILGAAKRLTRLDNPQTNGMVERLDNTSCQMLSHLVAPISRWTGAKC